jgi:hypothetical protein
MARKLRLEYPGAIYHPPSLKASVYAKASPDKTAGQA